MKEYLESLNQKLDDALVNQLKVEAESGKIPIIHDDSLAFIEQLVTIARAERLLEIGGAIGYFAINITLTTLAKVTSIEIDQALADQARANIVAAGLENKITFITADALEVDIDALGAFDVILIDGAKAKYRAYFEKFAPILKQGGFIISDNLLFRGQVAHPETIISRNRRQLVGKIQKYNEFLVRQTDFKTRFYPLGDGMAVSIKTR
jgi:predicted O-methyltransferase YrrM